MKAVKRLICEVIYEVICCTHWRFHHFLFRFLSPMLNIMRKEIIINSAILLPKDLCLLVCAYTNAETPSTFIIM